MLSGCNFAVKHDSSKDLTRLQRTGYSNDWLVCPPGTCNEGKEIEIPIFLNNLEELIRTAQKIFNQQPRTKLVSSVPELNQLIFIQRSKIFGFPDTIWVQFLILEKGISLAMYSRSNYGYYDFGVNRRRLNTWIEELKKAVE